MERNEAIESLRQLYSNANAENKAALECLIPELAESEDERIRTRLYEYFQGLLKGNEDCYKDGGYVRWEDLDVKSILAYLEKQKEQKPAEWSEEYREEDLRTRFAFYTYKDEDGVLYLSNVFIEETSRNKGFGTKILQAAEKVAETIGATAIRLKVKQDSSANTWYRKHGYCYMTFEDGYDWLEKTLEYLKPIRQEWSEEDESKKERLISIVKRALHGNEYPILNDNGATELITWLKSLRPQPHWKPSEEQIEALEHFIRSWGESGTMSPQNPILCAAKSLLIDLKKL